MRVTPKALIAAVLISGAALGFAIGACAQAAPAKPVWSPSSGQSLFQALGVNIRGTHARSQNLPPINTSLVLGQVSIQGQISTQKIKPSVLVYSPVYISASAPIPATVLQPSLPPREDSKRSAGSFSATSSPKPLMPLSAKVDDGAESIEKIKPILVAQNSLTQNSLAQRSVVENVAPQSLPPAAPINMPDMTDMTNTSSWAGILSKYTKLGRDGLTRFDYAGLKSSASDMKALGEYIAALSAKAPSNMDRNHAMAYWANLYNAQTVLVVAENYPVSSIRKIKSGYRAGPWRRKFTSVEGETLSLDNIEHDIMRPQFNTPLVHYMVNCASIGCPNLKASPWQAQTLDIDLEAAARAYINSPRGISFPKNRLRASSIYKWFQKDFGDNDGGVIKHLIKYADADLKMQLEGHTKIDKFGYNWDINAK